MLAITRTMVPHNHVRTHSGHTKTNTKTLFKLKRRLQFCFINDRPIFKYVRNKLRKDILRPNPKFEFGLVSWIYETTNSAMRQSISNRLNQGALEIQNKN